MAAKNSTAECRRFRGLVKNHVETIDQNPKISPLLAPTRSKSTISSLFLSTFTFNTSSSKKTNFSFATLRGLGCTSSAQVSAPSVIRSSADWQTKRVKKKKQRRKNQTNAVAVVVVPDVWCSPSFAFAAEAAASVDCVDSRRPTPSRDRAVDGERNHRERSCIGRRSSNHEQIPAFDSLSASSASEREDSLPDPIRSGHYPHLRGLHGSPGGLDEIMMFQTSLLLGESDIYDRYRGWQVDIDNMSYEELLELGDRIGYVSTGLREEEIFRCLIKMNYSILDALPSHFSTEFEPKCSICQEEYEVGDEMGKLECGHSYHICCIKQWLLRKNACPICKAAAAQH